MNIKKSGIFVTNLLQTGLKKFRQIFNTRKRITILTVVLLGVGFLGFRVFGTKAQQVQYQTAQVQKGSIISTLSENGNVSTTGQVSVTSPTDGIISELYAKNGDIVTAGQNLFKVKSTATPQQQAAAYASYLSALNSSKTAQTNKMVVQATLEKDRQALIDAGTAVTNMNNNRNVSANNPATKQPYTQNDIDSINSTYTSAQETFNADQQKYNDINTSIAASQAQANSAWLSYQATQDSVVTAPVSGTVANLAVTIGSNVSAGTNTVTSSTNTSGATTTSSSSTAGSTVLIIGNFSSLMIKTQVSEMDIPKIRPGQKATITLDAFPDKTFVGIVNGVDSVGAISSGVVTYTANIGLVSPPTDVQPGMSATVVIQTDRKDDILTVPSSAVQTLNGQSTVRTMKNGKINVVPVETGITSDSQTEITSGLTEGETIVTSVVSSQNRSTNSQSSSPFSALGGNRGGFGGGAVFRTGGR